MKFVFLSGGLAGFTLAAGAGLWSGQGSDRILFDATTGCLVGAILFRWLWSVCLRGFRETYLANQRTPTAKPAKN